MSFRYYCHARNGAKIAALRLTTVRVVEVYSRERRLVKYATTYTPGNERRRKSPELCAYIVHFVVSNRRIRIRFAKYRPLCEVFQLCSRIACDDCTSNATNAIMKRLMLSGNQAQYGWLNDGEVDLRIKDAGSWFALPAIRPELVDDCANEYPSTSQKDPLLRSLFKSVAMWYSQALMPLKSVTSFQSWTVSWKWPRQARVNSGYLEAAFETHAGSPCYKRADAWNASVRN